MGAKNKYSTTKDLIKAVSKQTGTDPSLAKKIIDMYLLEIEKNLHQGTKVRLNEFGTFELTSWKSKEIFDINIGQKVYRDIKTILFKPSQILSKKVLD